MKRNWLFVGGLGATKALFVCCALFASRSGWAEDKPTAPSPQKTGIAVNVAQQIPHQDVIGKWKVHVFEVERNPTVIIDDLTDSKVTGTYIGPLGHFPLTGTYAEDSGDVHLKVDFSASPIARFKRLKQLIGNLDGQLKGPTIAGLATFPDMENRQFRWEAKKDGATKKNERRDQ